MQGTTGAPPAGEHRIFGLDLLRILSMVMVIILHLLGQGGILGASAPGSFRDLTARALECICYCAVDCYGLLSGYLSPARGRTGYAKAALLWLEVAVYSLVYACVFRCVSPEYAGKRELLNALFPVLRRQYWYFTAYFALALFGPILSEGLRRVSKPSALPLALGLTLFFCVLPTLFCTDPFSLKGGYSALWLILLFVLGALLNKSGLPEGIPPGVPASCFLLCTGLTFLLTALHPVSIPGLGTLALLSYTSPTVLLSAASLLLLLRSLRIRSKALQRGLTRLSGASFAVYILHTNPLLWKHVFYPGVLKPFAQLPAWIFPFCIVACAVLVYMAGCAVDSLRARLFKKLGIRERLEAFDRRMRRKLPAEE